MVSLDFFKGITDKFPFDSIYSRFFGDTTFFPIQSLISERVGRVLSCFSIMVPLALVATKVFLPSVHPIKREQIQSDLEEGIDISDDLITKIQDLIPKILEKKADDQIQWLSVNNLVFKLVGHPEFIFKRESYGFHYGGVRPSNHITTDTRFENMLKAKEVCLTHGLDLLVVPHAKKIVVNVGKNDYPFIVEESLDVVFKGSINEELYDKYSSELNETTRQLAIFIAKTGFNDVTWRNIPIMNQSHISGNRKVALIDLEHMTSARNGFLGDRNGSLGLIQCVAQKQIDIVIKEAFKYRVPISRKEANEAKQERLKALARNQMLLDFYKEKRIITGKEAIEIDLESLDLNLEEMDTNGCDLLDKARLRELVQYIVDSLNQKIQKTSIESSVKAQRQCCLDITEGLLSRYYELEVFNDSRYSNENFERKMFLDRIFQILVDKKCIFEFKPDYFIYNIQA